MGGNIVLVGFMGCGKTSVGRRLAHLTGMKLVDTDELICEDAGVSIPEIFAEEGEVGFRAREAAALESLEGLRGAVISTGGGIVLAVTNRARLRALGLVCWLDAPAEVLFERAARSGRRPLLQTENPREVFDRLLAERRALYEEVADFRVQTASLDHEGVARQILAEMASRRGPREKSPL